MVKISKKVEENLEKELEEEIVKAEVEASEITAEIKKGRFNKKFILMSFIILILAAIPSVYLYFQYSSLKSQLEGPQSNATNQTQQLIEKVGKLMELPKDEQPRMATVTDENVLSGKLFFAKAKNGDKVLVYSKLGKAIFYRESTNKIVDIAFVSVGSDNQAQVNPAPTVLVSEQASVKVINGTLTAGLARKVGATIEKDLTNITLKGVGDALNGDYKTTVVVDISGKKPQATAQVAKLLGVKVSVEIPDGELKPDNVDILVILGEDLNN